MFRVATIQQAFKKSRRISNDSPSNLLQSTLTPISAVPLIQLELDPLKRKFRRVLNQEEINLLSSTLNFTVEPRPHSLPNSLIKRRLRIVTEEVNNLALRSSQVAANPFIQTLDGFSGRKRSPRDLEIANLLPGLLSVPPALPFVQSLEGFNKRKKVIRDLEIPNILIGTLSLAPGIPGFQKEISASALKQVYKRYLANKFIEIPNLLTSTMNTSDTTGHCNIYAIVVSKRFGKRN